jgi:transcription initiation factor TFIIIB Brf1 subunit/transcription initiation factor TFIIB
MLSSACSDVIVNALQELKIATYASLRQYDHTYSPFSYMSTLKTMEARGQVKRLSIRIGGNEYCLWTLPWYEEDASAVLAQLEQGTLGHLEIGPSTSRELQVYFREQYPAYHQIAFVVLQRLVGNGKVSRLAFDNKGKWVSIYYLSERQASLDDLLLTASGQMNRDGFAFATELSNSIGISRPLAYAILEKLVHDGKITKFRVGWNYARNMPIFVYCKDGHEPEAVKRYREFVSRGQVQKRKSRLVGEYLSRFRESCIQIKASDSLADLASSYFERALESGWIRGRSNEIVAWSAFYLASKVLKQGVMLGDIEGCLNIKSPREKRSWKKSKSRRSDKSVRKYSLLAVSKELNDYLQLDVVDLYPNPTDYVQRIVMKMGLPDRLGDVVDGNYINRSQLLEETTQFISSLPRQMLFGKRPEGVAAASLYITAKRLGIRTCLQRPVADASDITEVTLRNILRSIEGALSKPIQVGPSDVVSRKGLSASTLELENGKSPNGEDHACAGCGLSEADGEKLTWSTQEECWLCHDCAAYDVNAGVEASSGEEDGGLSE